jgi:hypothetical protein
MCGFVGLCLSVLILFRFVYLLAEVCVSSS